MEKLSRRRLFKLQIWGLALGYFAFYVPYSLLIKVVTTNAWPGINGPVSGFRILPAVIISTAVALPCLVSLKGWWKYARRREFARVNIVWPEPLVLLSGFGTAVIIGTTTLAFTFTGVSIVFALLLMRGGVLVIAPVVDVLFNRRVRWFSWIALACTFPALFLALTDVKNYQLTPITILIVAAYLTGYLLRLPCLTKLAKTDDKATTRAYFVEESTVAVFFLVVIPAVFALIGKGEVMMELRHGFIVSLSTGVTLPAILIGVLYAGLYYFGTLIYLDCRENTFCIPLNRGSSLLAGIVSTYALAVLFAQKPPSVAQLGSAAMIVIALLFLSPLHHFDRYLAKLRNALASLRLKSAGLIQDEQSHLPAALIALTQSANAEPTPLIFSDQLRIRQPQLILFVCSGNTCRSPMAAAIGRAEIAARLQISLQDVERAPMKAASAGVSAKVGEPMTAEAKQALRQLGFHPNGHKARSLTVELADQAEEIFCMTESHRNAVVKLVPAAAAKTHCLDPDGDIEDPIGSELPAYINCARRIHELVRLRFDEISLRA